MLFFYCVCASRTQAALPALDNTLIQDLAYVRMHCVEDTPSKVVADATLNT